jgi:hypothetical protein
MSYLNKFLETGGFLTRATDKTDKTPRMNGVSSVLSVASGIHTEKSAPSADPTGPPVGEPVRPAGPSGWGPLPPDRGWRQTVESWPVEWRAVWCRLAKSHQAAGTSWDVAEWIAYNETARDLVEAERRGEVPESAFASPAARDGVPDEGGVTGSEVAFGGSDPAPAAPAERRPRDVRRGDRWLPWHFRGEAS